MITAAKNLFCISLFGVAVVGCTTSSNPSNLTHKCEVLRQEIAVQSPVDTRTQDVARKRRMAAVEDAKALRTKGENGWDNEDILRDFALRESPSLWQTIQAIRAEVAVRRKKLARLRVDLQEFNRKPESDKDYRRWDSEIDSLLDSLVAVFSKLEEAYIAAKKFELLPSIASNRDAMKRALEERVKEADNATKRYREMTK